MTASIPRACGGEAAMSTTMTNKLRKLAALGLLLVASSASAQPAPAGPGYELIDPAQPTAAPAGQVEVIEVFNHACMACYQFQPKVAAWLKRKPANVAFSYVAAPLGGHFDAFARAYYAAEALGAAEKTHQGVFDAVFGKAQPKNNLTLEELADLYAGLGVDKAQFLAAANSFAVNTRMKRTTQQLVRLGATSTPTIVVAGKYRITGQTAGGFENVFRIVDQLVAQESAAAAPAAR
jgi:protein dithiol oxidoreductase (disulfide-forming)